MLKSTLTLVALSALFLGLRSPSPAPTVSSSPAIYPVHCQVPCGIYTDTMRIEMLMEDCETIEKAMVELATEPDSPQARQQAIRWVVTKEEHASKIQETVAAYWLAQRIKQPAEAEGLAKYHQQLTLMHEITVLAMKCKQTLEVGHVAALREKAKAFSETYFSKEDLEHMSGHHGK